MHPLMPFNFKGRINRTQFTTYMHIYDAILLMVLIVVFLVLGVGRHPFMYLAWGLGLVFIDMVLATGLVVRRLHDMGESGKLVVLMFVPGVSAALAWILMIRPGIKGPNQYGPEPYYTRFDYTTNPTT